MHLPKSARPRRG